MSEKFTTPRFARPVRSAGRRAGRSAKGCPLRWLAILVRSHSLRRPHGTGHRVRRQGGVAARAFLSGATSHVKWARRSIMPNPGGQAACRKLARVSLTGCLTHRRAFDRCKRQQHEQTKRALQRAANHAGERPTVVTLMLPKHRDPQSPAAGPPTAPTRPPTCLGRPPRTPAAAREQRSRL